MKPAFWRLLENAEPPNHQSPNFEAPGPTCRDAHGESPTPQDDFMCIRNLGFTKDLVD